MLLAGSGAKARPWPPEKVLRETYRAVGVLYGRFRALSDEKVDHAEVVALAGQVEGRVALGVLRIDVPALGGEDSDGLKVG